jgi:hypothetical protein
VLAAGKDQVIIFFFFKIASIFDMTIKAPSEKEAKKVKIAVSRDPVTTSFEKWACD